MVTSSLPSKKPRKTCNDPNCPFHGTLPIRGNVVEGVVISDKMDKTVIVRRDFLNYVTKFKRYERRHSHIPAHNPPCCQLRFPQLFNDHKRDGFTYGVAFRYLYRVSSFEGETRGVMRGNMAVPSFISFEFCHVI